MPGVACEELSEASVSASLLADDVQPRQAYEAACVGGDD